MDYADSFICVILPKCAESFPTDLPAPPPPPARQHQPNRARIEPVLHPVHAREQTCFRVARPNRYGLLKNNRPVVNLLIDEVDRDPGDLSTPRQGVADRGSTGKGRQEGGMDVEEPVAEAAHEDRKS